MSRRILHRCHVTRTSEKRTREKCHKREITASISTRIHRLRVSAIIVPARCYLSQAGTSNRLLPVISAWMEKLEIMCICLLLADCSHLTCDYRYKTSFIGSQRSQWVTFSFSSLSFRTRVTLVRFIDSRLNTVRFDSREVAKN